MNEVSISKDIINLYYDSIRKCIELDSYPLEEFCKKYPNEYKLLSAIHRRRSRINIAIKALKLLNKDIYWGTLTFNNKKDKNLISTKRKEAFTNLNKLFDYFMLVEEYGEKNNRYHIHFIGSMKFGKTTSDFYKKDIWKSRRDIHLVDTNRNISSYLVKYLSKDIPRIRSNKMMVKLIKAYKIGDRFDNLHFSSIGKCYQVGVVNAISIFDLES